MVLVKPQIVLVVGLFIGATLVFSSPVNAAAPVYENFEDPGMESPTGPNAMNDRARPAEGRSGLGIDLAPKGTAPVFYRMGEVTLPTDHGVRFDQVVSFSYYYRLPGNAQGPPDFAHARFHQSLALDLDGDGDRDRSLIRDQNFLYGAALSGDIPATEQEDWLDQTTGWVQRVLDGTSYWCDVDNLVYCRDNGGTKSLAHWMATYPQAAVLSATIGVSTDQTEPWTASSVLVDDASLLATSGPIRLTGSTCGSASFKWVADALDCATYGSRVLLQRGTTHVEDVDLDVAGVTLCPAPSYTSTVCTHAASTTAIRGTGNAAYTFTVSADDVTVRGITIENPDDRRTSSTQYYDHHDFSLVWVHDADDVTFHTTRLGPVAADLLPGESRKYSINVNIGSNVGDVSIVRSDFIYTPAASGTCHVAPCHAKAISAWDGAARVAAVANYVPGEYDVAFDLEATNSHLTWNRFDTSKMAIRLESAGAHKVNNNTFREAGDKLFLGTAMAVDARYNAWGPETLPEVEAEVKGAGGGNVDVECFRDAAFQLLCPPIADFDIVALDSHGWPKTMYFPDKSQTWGAGVVDRVWTFHDGGKMASKNGEKTYTGAGTFPVTLDFTTTTGYPATVTKTVALTNDPYQLSLQRVGGPIATAPGDEVRLQAVATNTGTQTTGVTPNAPAWLTVEGPTTLAPGASGTFYLNGTADETSSNVLFSVAPTSGTPAAVQWPLEMPIQVRILIDQFHAMGDDIQGKVRVKYVANGAPVAGAYVYMREAGPMFLVPSTIERGPTDSNGLLNFTWDADDVGPRLPGTHRLEATADYGPVSVGHTRTYTVD